MTYTNAQLRSILNGLRYTNLHEMTDAIFPLSIEDSPLTNSPFVLAIQKFQLDHQLEVTGTLDSITLTTIQRVMQTLLSDLNQTNHTHILLDRPVYDATTIAVVKLVQQRLPADDSLSFNASSTNAAASAKLTTACSHLPKFREFNLSTSR